MKKFTILFSLLLAIFSLQGQKLWKGGQIDYSPPVIKQKTSQAELNMLQANLKNADLQSTVQKAADCSVDTSLFPLVKTQISLGLDGLANTTNRFSSVMQRYGVPQGGSVTVSGFDFHAYYVYDTAAPTAISQPLMAHLYNTVDGGDPLTATPLASVSISVDTSGGTRPSGSIFLSETKYSVTFATPVTVTDSFFVAVENPGTNLVGIFRNATSQNGNAGDGAGAEDGWLVFNDGTGNFLLPAPAISANNGATIWDVDYLLYPHIEYSIDADFDLAEGDCLPHGEVSIFENKSTGMTGNKYYNFFTGRATVTGQPDSAWLWTADTANQNAATSWGTRDFITSYTAPTTQAVVALQAVEIGYSRVCLDEEFKTYNSGPLATSSFTFEVDTAQTVTFTNNSTGTDFLWDFGDGNTSTEVIPTHTYATGGNYTVTLTASGDGVCPATSTQQVDVATTSIMDDLLNSQVNIYPNPSSGLFTLDINMDQAEQVRIEVRNMIGQQVFEATPGFIQSGEIKVDIQNQQSGIYLLTLRANERQITRKLSLK